MRGDFDMFYQLIGKNGVLMNATDIIDTLVFRSLIDLGDWGDGIGSRLISVRALFYHHCACQLDR